VASGPGQDLVLSVATTGSGRYYFRVDSPRADSFAVGHYRLVVDPNDPVATAGRRAFRQALLGLSSDDDTMDRAIDLQPLVAASSAVGAYAVQGEISDSGDVDYYRLADSTASSSLNVFLSGTGVMSVSVLDSFGRVLAEQAASGSLSLRLDSLPTTGDLYLVVTGSGATTYRLGALRNAPADSPALTATGTLSATVPLTYRGLVLGASSLVRTDLLFTSSQSGAAVEAVLFDSQGSVVYRQVVPVGQRFTLELFLPADAYTWRFLGGTPTGTMDDVAFQVAVVLLSDPIGPALIDPGAPPPPPPTTNWSYLGFITSVPLLDPFGRPFGIYYPPQAVAMIPPNLPPLIPRLVWPLISLLP